MLGDFFGSTGNLVLYGNITGNHIYDFSSSGHDTLRVFS
jgi:hypothetical protein